ncbi:MAG: hypothetical protein WCP57_04685 [Bacteroidota bacterium]
MTNSKKYLQITLQELLWLLLIAVINFVILYPIINLGTYKFLWATIMFISIAILYARWLVFFNDLFYLKNKWVKIGIFLFNFQLIIFSLSKLQDIIPLWETQSLMEFLYHVKRVVSINDTVDFLNYIKNVVLLSGISCCVAALFLSIRIFSSFFTANRMRKKAMLEDL